MIINKFSKLRSILKIESKIYGSRSIIKSYFKDPRFRVNFWLRTGTYIKSKNFFLNEPILRLIKNKLAIKYGFDTTFNVHIDVGLRIVHLGGIVIHGNCEIGKNLTILNNVTLGQGQRNPERIPRVGDNVYIGVGAILLGDISIGNNVTIGALSFINKSIGDNLVVAGTPMKFLN